MKKIIKKCIIKYLLKYFKGSPKNYYYVKNHVKFYLFLRWLSEFVKNEEDTKHVMVSIASYMYYNRVNLPFTDIFVIGNVVCICTTRPSMWIGKAGCIIEEIIKKLNFSLKEEKTHNFKIQLLETTKSAVVDIYDYIEAFGDY